jgi:hypothetical protein
MMFSAPEQTLQNGKAFAASIMDKISLIPYLHSQQSGKRSVGVTPLAFGFFLIMDYRTTHRTVYVNMTAHSLIIFSTSNHKSQLFYW